MACVVAARPEPLRPAKDASDGASPWNGNALPFIAIAVDPDEGILVEGGDPHCAFRVQANAAGILEAAKPATEHEPAIGFDFIVGQALAIHFGDDEPDCPPR